MTEQQQIDRLIKAIEEYQRRKHPLDFTESETELLTAALNTRKNALDLIARMEDDRK